MTQQIANKRCVECLKPLIPTPLGPAWMSPEHQAAIKNGDYFRNNCSKPTHANGNCYFWDIPGQLALDRATSNVGERLIAGINAANVHEETETGPAVGNEFPNGETAGAKK